MPRKPFLLACYPDGHIQLQKNAEVPKDQSLCRDLQNQRDTLTVDGIFKALSAHVAPEPDNPQQYLYQENYRLELHALTKPFSLTTHVAENVRLDVQLDAHDWPLPTPLQHAFGTINGENIKKCTLRTKPLDGNSPVSCDMDFS